MTNSTVEISVVVATCNRADLLEKLLMSLQKQYFPGQNFEVVVAGDGCTDTTAELMARMAGQMPNLRWLDLPKGNPGKARNAAAKAAKGRIIAFTDDDCIALPEWLQVIYQRFAREKKEVVYLQGKTVTDRAKVTPFTHQIENLKGHAAVPTCNSAIKKSAFEAVNGFDEHFPFAHNEDADLAWRVAEVGAIVFVPQMVIEHPPRPAGFGKQASRMRILESEFMLYYKNPERYRKWRSTSPWKTIYSEVFFKHQLLILKSRLRFWKRPATFIKSVLLSLYWWADLLLRLPAFARANQYYSKMYHRKNVSGS